MVGRLNRKWIWMAGGFIFLLFYYIFDPMKYGWMPQCFFHKMTGLRCMGCGSQRVVHSLLHGDLSGALHANAFLVFALPFILFLLVVEFCRNRYPGLYKKVHSKTIIITITAMLLAWLFIRNIYGL